MICRKIINPKGIQLRIIDQLSDYLTGPAPGRIPLKESNCVSGLAAALEETQRRWVLTPQETSLKLPSLDWWENL